MSNLTRCAVIISTLALVIAADIAAQEPAADRRNLAGYGVPKLQVGPGDWPQWCGTSLRNNTPVGRNIPIDWDVGKFDRRTRRWLPKTARNIKWVARMGSQTYAAPIVANGKVFIGTNNNGGYVKRFPPRVDLGCLLCFDEATGRFLWQHSNRKLASGRVHDWPMQGIVSVPVVSGDRLWYVTNRGEVVCLDTEGFLDNEDDVPYHDPHEAPDEADVVWRFDMMKQLGVSPHNMCTCSPTLAEGILFVVTSNGVDNSHVNIPNPEAPAFLAIDAKSGKVLWTDNSPGTNILHGSWSSPSYAVLGGTPQVLFPGGDGWLYSFAPRGDGTGRAKLLWKFDCNLKTSKWILGGRGSRNEYLTLPVIYDQKVYIAVGQDAEHGEGDGHLWCIDPTRRIDGSDVSPTLAYDTQGKRLRQRRYQFVDPGRAENEMPNPRSALVWHYQGTDLDDDGDYSFEESMHRSCGSATIKNGLLVIADFSGLVHCVDAHTGAAYWTHDLLSAAWAASPLIVEDKIYTTDEDGDVTIFKLSKQKQILSRDDDGRPGPISMLNSTYTTPIVANNVLFIANRTHLYAIEAKKE